MTFRDRLKTAKRNLRYFLIYSIFFAISMQPVRRIPRIKRLLLNLIPVFFRKEMGRAKELLPPEFHCRADEIISGMAENQVSTLLEVFFYEKILVEFPDFVTMEGQEIFARARNEGRGIIILTGHFGNWELIAYSISRLGFTLHAVARPQAVNSMTEFMNGFREARGVKVLMDGNLRESLRLLRKGKIVGIVSDLNARERGYQVDFFGRKASFYPTPVILAERSGAYLIPTFIEREGPLKHKIRFETPLSWNPDETMCQRIKHYVGRFEEAFRRRPDQWVWFHERYSHVELGRTD